MSISIDTPSVPLPHPKYGMWYVEQSFRDAAYRGNVSRMEKILKLYPNFNINAVNEYNETAFYIACKNNQNDAINYLLNHSQVDVNVQTICGNSPMLTAAWNDNTHVVKRLLEKSADVTLKTKVDREYHGGVTALDIAKERENHELVALLEKHFSNTDTFKVSP